MVIGKKGQFFLLAAVIISVVVISLGAVTNRAVVSKGPIGFDDFSYEVEREVGAVLDYEVYSGFDDDANLTKFVELLAADISDRDPDANFVFIYGNNTDMTLKNYGDESAFVGDDEAEAGKVGVISKICYGGSCDSITNVAETKGHKISKDDMVGQDNINVTIEGNEFVFPISGHKQVIFIIQKGVNDESFVTVR
jgi:hypothetical protein